ncbi:MAG TPA: sulfotransferase domain-containing protein [Rhizomicrobium sp.]
MTDTVAHRARSMAEFGAFMDRAFGRDNYKSAIAAYRPRRHDVVISPFSKCGTTWLQQTFHTLRTRGDMDFDDISRVVPWIETSRTLGIDLEAPQRAQPRGFKSHLSYYDMPKGARYVVSLREPKDAMVSLYRFMEGWFLEPGAVSLSEFAQGRLAKGGQDPGYWQHLISWWEQRDNPDVLLLSYEHMSADPERHVRKLAAFCGIALDDALLRLTLERSSFAYMLRHKDLFDDAMMRKLSEARCNLPPGSDSAKVRQGGSGGHRGVMPDELAATLDAIWTDVVAPKTGFADYALLEAELRRRNTAA